MVRVPRGTYRPRIVYPSTAVSEFDARTFDLGLQEREVAPGERVGIYGAARSVVDVMRLLSRSTMHALWMWRDRCARPSRRC